MRADASSLNSATDKPAKLRAGPSQRTRAPSASARLRARWLFAGSLLASEILWLSLAFDSPEESAVTSEWAARLVSVVPHIAAIIVTMTVVLVVSASARLGFGLFVHQKDYRWWPWAVLHGLAVVTFTLLTAAGFGDAPPPPLSLVWVFMWMTVGATSFATWLLLIAPPESWIRVLRQPWITLATGLGAGAAVWVGGLLAQDLWRPLAGGTLRLSGLLLSLVYDEITYDPVQGLLGSSAFRVEIAPVCSGYEGIALVTVFTATYLGLFRAQLSFPRALILFPIGIIIIWVTNVVRVTALIVIGTSVSSEVASRGFHSQAGWIAFTLVTLGLIFISHRWLLRTRPEGSWETATHGPELALLLPLIALMATTMVTAAASAGFDAMYPLGVLVTGAVLWHYRKSYRHLFGPLTWEPFAIGALVFVIWAILVPGSGGDGQPLADRLSQWPAWLAAAWLLFRVLGSVVTVPLAEELAFRGYLIHKLVARDFEQVPPGQFTWLSFILSSALFGLLHQHLVAGTLAGGAFALALYRRGRVGDAILAHVTSNALIAAAVLAAGQWGLWD